jgi:hypothetical protein
VSTSLKLLKVTRGPCGALRLYAHARWGVIETMTTWDDADGPTIIRVERIAKRQALIRSIAKALKADQRNKAVGSMTRRIGETWHRKKRAAGGST